MSKAGEWRNVKVACDASRPVFRVDNGQDGQVVRAAVTDEGWLAVYALGQQPRFLPTDALALAAWIVATFGEPEPRP